MSPSGGRLAVGVNLLWLVPGVVGGSEEYLVRSLLAFAEHQPDDVDLTVFGLAELARAHPALADAFPLVTLPLRGRLKGLRVGAEQSWLPAQVARRRLDVVHHGGGVVPLVHRGRTVLTVHDIQPLEFPERFSRAKRMYLGAMLPRSVRAADVVVTTSGWVRDSVVRRLGADPERCHIVPPPAGRAGSIPPPAGGDSAGVAARFGIGPTYVVYPAITYEHKNHRVLIEALARMREGAGANLELVLCGGVGEAEATVSGLIERHGLAGRAHRLGRVSRADLDALVAGAVALVFPSSYEGFGLPVLEAMAAGVPVAAAYSTALGEVVGDGGILVPTHDVEAWARALEDLVSQPGLRATLGAAGRDRAAVFTTELTARCLADAYRAAAGGQTTPAPGAPRPAGRTV